MKVDLEFVELSTPLFLGKVNFGLKIEPTTKGKSLKMWYDTDSGLTYIIYQDKVSIHTKTENMVMYDPSQLGIAIQKQPQKLSDTTTKDVPFQVKAQVSGPGIGLKSAQVETPISKVQGTPGRKAKFQGQESQGE